MISQKIHDSSFCASCYFRSIATPPYKKIMLQLTEKCNLCCKHCFVSSTSSGNEMEYDKIENILLPHLIQANVKKVTLTGGEPFVFSRLLDVIRLLNNNNIQISICTNASLITEKFLDEILDINKIHFNVSLDGFSNSSHGAFRGNSDEKIFKRIISNISMLGRYHLLNGILVTPNHYTKIEEYEKICKFGKEVGAKYVLINPLSSFGRGEKTYSLGYTQDELIKLYDITQKYDSADFEIIYIRFPNTAQKPLEKCVAGKISYVFTSGEVAICPYMAFAAKDTISRYEPEQFIIGNAFTESFNLDEALTNYKLPFDSCGEQCSGCAYTECSKGCYAAKISTGHILSDADLEMCPRNFKS